MYSADAYSVGTGGGVVVYGVDTGYSFGVHGVDYGGGVSPREGLYNTL